ncbi:hypothetical protein P153DRAFT_293944 [Dothidotthia symphoricarpi CBS 119687]|uniref:Zn(2)-C6 fungal-type domain-containing protein n=1 Tax=Dothidotthia symphoricarpi CBS 119687 TaxID=1392245 RepID=A0A6A6A7S9_9PLEO|nr:uncharacterized protein P153DRAFT_293944 [Dothidotthia symphoricarpi CBS 119687]KAF2127919.1 hypothetical protein P153DRAFT_293944 [Dothidotthia symphoricarpi CBS 119687]
MSVMEYDTSRRSLSHALQYDNYYYNNRNAPLAVSYASRSDPRGCPVGRSMNSTRGRSSTAQENAPSESGQSRRRIAVACARCRKRKIRCSGDPGTGLGCTNCNQAGIDPTHCQFHRVGSDQVHKVMDNLNIAHSLTGLANSHATMPTYSASGSMIYSRGMSTPQYPHVDTRLMYPSSWTIPFAEETSPVDVYDLDQSSTYLPNATSLTNTNLYGTSDRWSHPTARSFQPSTNAYFDRDPSYSAHGLPHIHTNLRPTPTTEALSPLNMSSLHLTLPERPHPRQLPDATAPRRQLPMPQPSPAQTRRDAVDMMQDQRLRSVQAMAAPPSTSGSFAKPALPWNMDGDNQINANISSGSTSADVAAQIPAPVPMESATDSTLDFPSTTTGGTDNPTSSHVQLNFSTSSLLDSINASAPPTTYSNFRECRLPTSSSKMVRQSSQTNLYSFDPDNTPKRNSFSGETTTSSQCVNGRKYMPLAHQSQRSSTTNSVHPTPFDDQHVPLHRASLGSLSSSF